MIILGEVVGRDVLNGRYNVRLPILEQAGNKNRVVVTARACITPGIYTDYTVGDIVFVDFQEMSLNKPIIMGKLYNGAASTGVLSLPGTTKLGTGANSMTIDELLIKVNTIATLASGILATNPANNS